MPEPVSRRVLVDRLEWVDQMVGEISKLPTPIGAGWRLTPN